MLPVPHNRNPRRECFLICCGLQVRDFISESLVLRAKRVEIPRLFCDFAVARMFELNLAGNEAEVRVGLKDSHQSL